MLCHSRDVHPTWVTFTMTGTLGSGLWFGFKESKFDENLDSF
jgi:hypothetical protein